MPAPQEFDELLIACLARMDAEGEHGLEAFCREHPERAERLRASVALLHEEGSRGAAPDGPPRALGEFELIGHLGQGRLGTVYLARRGGDARPLALKLVRPEALHFPGARQRFFREVDAVARLDHPGVVSVHAVGEAEGLPFVAMEYVRGVSLRALLTELGARNPATLTGNDLFRALVELHDAPSDTEAAQRPPFDDSWPGACLWIVRELSQALEHAHQRGVLHRSVRPENVMLTAEGRVVLLDFGLDPPQAGDSHGRPYRAPEQLEGRMHEISPRTDVYALGAVLFELLSFEQPPLSRMSTGEAGEELRRRVPSLSHDYHLVVGRATEPQTELRYRSAADLARDLTRLMEHRPVEARVPGAWAQLGRWARDNRAAAALVALGGGAAVLGSLAFGLNRWRAKNTVLAGARESELSEAEALRERDALARELETTRTDRDLLESRLASAGDERERAEAERGLAEANLERALATIDGLLEEVAALGWSDSDALVRSRGQLLEEARTLYTELETASGGDADIRWGAARIALALADHALDQGRVEAAESELRAQVSILRDLVDPAGLGFAGQGSAVAVEDVPSEYRGALALALARLAAIALERGETDRALELTDQGRGWLERGMILDELGDRAWVATWSVRRRTHQLLGEREPALFEADRAITVAQRYRDRYPDRDRAALLLAEELFQRASMSREGGTPGELRSVVGLLERGRATLEELVATGRREARTLERLVELCEHLADAERALDQAAAAFEAQARAVALAQELALQDPEGPGRQARLGELCLELARDEQAAGRPEPARRQLRRAAEALTASLEQSPGSDAERNQALLGDALVELGRLELARLASGTTRAAEAIGAFEAGVEARAAAALGADSDRVTEAQFDLGEAHLELARALAEAGDWERTAGELDRARRLLTADPERAPALARAWMEAAELAEAAAGAALAAEESGPEEAPLEQRVWAERLRSGALRTLEQSARQGVLDTADLASNPLWEPLRGELRFQALPGLLE